MSSTQPAPLPLVRDPLIGQNVGGYLVEDVLGEGGMGLVYRARHPLLNRHFAVKVLRPEIAADSASSGNFVREAQTLSTLKHPSITDIVGFGPLDDGRHYMVMEFLEGQTVEAELRSGRMDPERALKIADEVLDALSAAHSVSVIHRDLKPSNVFLARVSGGRELTKLLDFGLAKQQPVAMVGAGVALAAGKSAIAGTPEYIAPEQALGEPASKQSDLYSFGVMLFEMLTGVLPFESDHQLEGDERISRLMKKHINQTAPKLEESAAEVRFPEGLAEIVADLLKKTPAERPSSADIVRRRLERVHRSLQQDSTQQKPNPLLGPPPPGKEARSIPTEKVIRVGQTEKAITAGLGGKRKSGRRMIAIAIAALLLVLLWGLGSSRTEEDLLVEAPPVVPAIAAPAKAAVVPAIEEPAKVPSVAPIEEPAKVPGKAATEEPAKVPAAAGPDELSPLGPGTKAVAPVVKPAAAKLVEPAKRWVVMSSGCEPDAVWRDDAIRTMRELGEHAAQSPEKWKLYQRKEAGLTKAINSASERVGCGRASQQLGELTDAVLRE